MQLLNVSRFILLLAVLLLVLMGFFPSPLMIGLTAAASSVLVLWQCYPAGRWWADDRWGAVSV
ncbi:MAG: hypothetical protein AB8H12_05880 [Lewinella sp.]